MAVMVVMVMMVVRMVVMLAHGNDLFSVVVATAGLVVETHFGDCVGTESVAVGLKREIEIPFV